VSRRHPPVTGQGPTPEPAAQRVLARILIVETGYGTPCFLYQGALTSAGYGNVGDYDEDGKANNRPAHRVVYEAVFGPIPANHDLDHLCTRRNCCNPGHAQPVLTRENNRRVGLRRRERTETWLAAGEAHIYSATPALMAQDQWRRSRELARAAMRASFSAAPSATDSRTETLPPPAP
jgi:hypothetical protein